MTTQEEKVPHESPARELHIVTWNDFFPRRTDTAAEFPTPTLPLEDDKPSARAALERVVQADSSSRHSRASQLDTADVERKPIRDLRQAKIKRRSILSRRKPETPEEETTESPLFHMAITELGAGNREMARQLLRQVLRIDPKFEPGWLRMADAVDSDEERRFCLEQALGINRRNALARRELEALVASSTRTEQADLEKPPKATTEPRVSKNRLLRLRASLQKHSIPIAIIYLGVSFIVGAFALIMPQSRLVLYSILLVVLVAHIALTWRRSTHASNSS